ncbi:MAG: hypothetical protein KDA78_17395, partial [Planctomycetaceae bacterium]|nr:hypothetical protein [Planctomycetaceae bacterium]
MSVSRTTRPDLDRPGTGQGLPFGMSLDLIVNDPEVVQELSQFEEGDPREKFALQALKIGVLALKQARGQIDADVLRAEGKELLLGLQSKLDTHSQLVKAAVDAELKQYFDPESGRLHERLQRLVQQDGELEQLLQKHLGQQDSELVKTLAAHLGPESPLLRHLDPEET